MISEDVCRMVDNAVAESFVGATIVSVSPETDTDGRILFKRIVIRLPGGRKLRLIPDTHCGDPTIVAITDSRFGPRELDAYEDYSHLDAELRWHPEPPEPWDRE